MKYLQCLVEWHHSILNFLNIEDQFARTQYMSNIDGTDLNEGPIPGPGNSSENISWLPRTPKDELRALTSFKIAP